MPEHLGVDLGGFLTELPLPAALFDEQERVRWANEAFTRRCGHGQEVLGRPLSELSPTGLADTLRAEHETVRTLGTTLLRERTTGSPWRTYHFPLEQWPGGVGTILVDVTGHVEAVREARLWRSRLLDLLTSMPWPIAACSASGEILEANPPMAEFFGRSMNALRRVPLTELLKPTDPKVLPKIERTLRSGGRASYRFSAVPLAESASSTGGSMLLQQVPHPELDGAVLLAILDPEPPRAEPSRRHTTVTDQEARVLEQVALGRPSSAIARALELSTDGVNYHIARLRTRLGAANRTALVAAAYANGLLRPGQWPPRANRA